VSCKEDGRTAGVGRLHVSLDLGHRQRALSVRLAWPPQLHCFIYLFLLILFFALSFIYYHFLFLRECRQESSFATFCAEATGKRSARTSTPQETWIRQLQQINKVMTTARPVIIWRD
jgi:hypothetical protein